MVEIRRMTRADAAIAIGPIRESGWGDRRELFELFFSVDRCTPFVAVENVAGGPAGGIAEAGVAPGAGTAPAGRTDGTRAGEDAGADGGGAEEVIATGCAIANGPIGWVGMIWVSPRRRRMGLGRRITQHVCEELEGRGCESLVLIASRDGQPVYTAMGFRVVAEYAIYEAPALPRPPAPPDGTILRPIRRTDLDAIAALDRRATGEDRRPVLEYLAPRGWLLSGSGGDRLRGFVLPTDQATGAVIADRPEDALCLLDVRRYLSPANGRAAVVAANGPAREALEASGWRFLFTTPRMVRGPALPWEPELIWGVFGFAMG